MIVFAEGFDAINSTTMLNYYTSDGFTGSVGASPDGRADGRSLRTNPGTGGSLVSWQNPHDLLYKYWSHYENSDEGVVGMAIYIGGAPTGNAMVFGLLDEDGTRQCGLMLRSDMRLAVFKTNAAGVVAVSDTILRTNTWYFIEVGFTISATGNYQLKINGGQDMVGSGDFLTSAKEHHAAIAIGGTTGEETLWGYYDDIYISDGLVYRGDVYVETLMPNKDGYVSDFEGSDGNSRKNYEMVDDRDPNVAGTYVVDNDDDGNVPSAFDMEDLYNIEEMSFEGEIQAVIIGTRHNDEISVGNQRQFQHQLRTGGIVGLSPLQEGTQPPDDVTYYERRWPATKPTGEWEGIDIASLEIGMITRDTLPTP